ncbi:hypothetical protein Ahy_B03g065334 isoform D [Arachis hypogaea]|uniref:Uncharacterized protein n=1 Tax=Arachis hypogaea TaxID=3818 RepID=A0A445A1D9_ARAHY|nr:hypothetical protein Ahy_B03g065334 isoform D [Arachis hypogaea]
MRSAAASIRIGVKACTRNKVPLFVLDPISPLDSPLLSWVFEQLWASLISSICFSKTSNLDSMTARMETMHRTPKICALIPVVTLNQAFNSYDYVSLILSFD